MITIRHCQCRVVLLVQFVCLQLPDPSISIKQQANTATNTALEGKLNQIRTYAGEQQANTNIFMSLNFEG
jgi:hypothetical protein